MVYIFPALLYVRLKHVQGNQAVEGGDLEETGHKAGQAYTRLGSNERLQEEDVGSLLSETLRLSFQEKEYQPHAFLFSWGVVTGILGVVITILTQAKVISGG